MAAFFSYIFYKLVDLKLWFNGGVKSPSHIRKKNKIKTKNVYFGLDFSARKLVYKFKKGPKVLSLMVKLYPRLK